MPMTAIRSIASALDLNQVLPLTEEPEVPPPDFGPTFPEPILHQNSPSCAENKPGRIESPPEVVGEPSTNIRTSPVEPWELSRGAQRLLKLIQKFIGKYGNFYASQCWIGDHLARCSRTIYNWTRELIRNGFISLRRRSQNTLVYTLLSRKISDQVSGQVSGQASGRYKEERKHSYIRTTTFTLKRTRARFADIPRKPPVMENSLLPGVTQAMIDDFIARRDAMLAARA